MSADILSLGEPLWEMSAIPSEPGKYTQGFGGDTLNFCVAAARQGARVQYVTRVGADPFGARIRALCESERVSTASIQVDELHSTGGYFIHHADGRHSFSYARSGSAASKLAPEHLDAQAIQRAKFVHSSGITQAISASAREAALALFSQARAAGVGTVFDPNLRLQLWTLEQARQACCDILQYTDYFFPSYEDAVALAGSERHEVIFDWAHQAGARVVVLKLGAQGSHISHKSTGERIEVPAFPVQAVDATGAGDCFAGSLVARLAAGDDVMQAIRYASAAAALTTTRYGAIAAIPHQSAVQDFLTEV